MRGARALELQLKPNSVLFQVVERFPRYVEKYTHTKDQAKWHFLFKREALVPLVVERTCRDRVAIRLLYTEVRWRRWQRGRRRLRARRA